MNRGTKITADREGGVVWVIQDGQKGGFKLQQA